MAPGDDRPPDRCSVVGVDVGGTFIDYCAVGPGGEVRTHKQLADRGDPAAALLRGLRAAAPGGAERVVHGTTVATNALLERRGARTGLLTTEGFADVLAIGRQDRPQLYALAPQRPEPLVPRALRREADERLDARGEVVRPLQPASVEAAIRCFADAGVEAVAVSLLFSFIRPEHEEAAAAMIRSALPGVVVCTSNQVLREHREYERTATTVAAAYVAPLVSRHLAAVAAGAGAELQVMQSNGGVVDAAEAAARSAHLVLSGPAGGVVGAMATAERAGTRRVLTLDMGGTSTDVALCPGEIPMTVEAAVAGLPIRVPMVGIHTIGAGGGSIARCDRDGALRVGPQSAGADPGPACYGRGGELPTVTDADSVLGRLPAGGLLGGSLRAEPDRASAALSALARSMGTGVEAAALGVLRVVHASMHRAVRRVSVERGHDPRGFTLVAFGGAGPMHAAELAEELEIERILVPRFPGVASACGMAEADEVRDHSRTVLVRLGAGDAAAGLEELWAPLEDRARAHPGGDLSRTADLRYRGQGHELEVPAGDLRRLERRFAEAHRRRYGFAEPGREVELVTVRLRSTRRRGAALRHPLGGGAGPRGTARVRFGAGWVEAALVEREPLAAGETVEGPAIVTQPDTATVLPPGWRGAVDEHANLVLTRRR